MEFNRIREILERYWEGTSSLEEEELLRSFFSVQHSNLPADLLEAQPLFSYFAAEAEREMPAVPAPVVTMPKPWHHWMKFAAAFLIITGLGYSIKRYQVKQEHMVAASLEKDTFDDPKEAYAVTQKALQLLVRNMQKGTTQMQKISYFNEATQYIKAD